MEFGGDDRQFQQAAQRVEQGMRGIAQQMKDSGDGVESLIIRYGKLSLAGTAAKHVGEALEQMTVKVRAGQASIGELVTETAKGIPVLGGFVEGLLGLAEAITGDKAAIEILKQQTAELENQIAIVAKLTKSHQDLEQVRRDQAKGVAVGLAGQNFTDAAIAILGIGGDPEATAAHIRKNVRDTFQAQLDAINAEKNKLGEKIRLSDITLLEGGSFDPEKRDEFRRQFNEAEKRAEQLRRDVTAAENVALEKIGDKAFSQLSNLAGGKLVTVFDDAGAAIKRFVGNIPVANRLTQQLAATFESLVQSRAGDIGKFLNEQGTLKFDAGRGAISPELFQKLSDKSFFDQAARSVGGILQQYAPIVETITRLIDSNLGISNFARNAAAAIGQAFPGRINTKAAEPFRASFVGLEDLGRRIQESAGSGGQDPVQTKLLERTATAAEKTATNTAKFRGPIGP